MRRNGKRRLEKYNLNTNSAILKRQIDSLKPLMLRSQSVYFNEMALIEEKTKQLIESVGVPVYQIPNYLFFAREIYRIRKKFKLGTLLSSGQERLLKWKNRGLNENLLIQVASLQGVTLYEIPEFVLTGDAQIGDVLLNKTFYNTNPNNKLVGIADLTEHQNNEHIKKGTAATGAATIYRILYSAPTIIDSCSITITRKSLVSTVSFSIFNTNTQVTEIHRDAINKTKETNISAANFASTGYFGHLQYSTEILDAGTYQYDLYYISSSGFRYLGGILKIIAVTF